MFAGTYKIRAASASATEFSTLLTLCSQMIEAQRQHCATMPAWSVPTRWASPQYCKQCLRPSCTGHAERPE